MRRLLILLLATVVLLTTVGFATSCGGPTAEKPVLLRVSTPWPPMDTPTVKIQEMADRFNARTGGKYVIEVHPGESLVKTQESLDAVRTGAVEMAGFPIGVFSAVDPRLAAAEVPFAYTGGRADAAAQDYLLPMYNEFMPDKFNQMMLAAWTCSGLEIASTKPVKTMADMKGMLVHSISPVCAQVIEALGAAPVSQPFVEGYSVLEKKVCDATIVATEFMIMFKVPEVADYLITGYIIPASLTLTINMDAYESLPGDIQNILIEEGLELQRDANAFFAEAAYANPDKLAGQGMEVYKLPAAEREKWREAVWPVSEQVVAAMGEWGQRFMNVANTVNSQYPY